MKFMLRWQSIIHGHEGTEVTRNEIKKRLVPTVSGQGIESAVIYCSRPFPRVRSYPFSRSLHAVPALLLHAEFVCALYFVQS